MHLRASSKSFWNQHASSWGEMLGLPTYLSFSPCIWGIGRNYDCGSVLGPLQFFLSFGNIFFLLGSYGAHAWVVCNRLLEVLMRNVEMRTVSIAADLTQWLTVTMTTTMYGVYGKSSDRMHNCFSSPRILRDTVVFWRFWLGICSILGQWNNETASPSCLFAMWWEFEPQKPPGLLKALQLTSCDKIRMGTPQKRMVYKGKSIYKWMIWHHLDSRGAFWRVPNRWVFFFPLCAMDHMDWYAKIVMSNFKAPHPSWETFWAQHLQT